MAILQRISHCCYIGLAMICCVGIAMFLSQLDTALLELEGLLRSNHLHMYQNTRLLLRA